MPEECESANALRIVADDITAQSFVVMSVDLITDVRLEVSSKTSESIEAAERKILRLTVYW